MNFEEIKSLIETVDNSGLTKIKLQKDDFKLTLEKQQATIIQQHTAPIAPVAPAPTATIINEPAPVTPVVPDEEATTKVLAPLVGVFYESSSPTAAPFVTIGQEVKVGDTLCILEAMKVLNEIKAPASGTIKAIHVANGDVVEFDQLLFEIQ